MNPSQNLTNVLFLGGSLSEQIMASQFYQSPLRGEMHYIPNPTSALYYNATDADFLSSYAHKTELPLGDIPRVLQFIRQTNPSLLLLGIPQWVNSPLVEHIKEENLPLLRLSEAAQKLNQSHSAWRQFLSHRSLRTPQASLFDNVDSVMQHFEIHSNPYPVLAKTDKTSSAKSKVCRSLHEVMDFLSITMQQSDDEKVLIQEHFEGHKFIMPALVFEHTLIAFPFCRKQILDDEMGQYVEASFSGPEITHRKNYIALEQEILIPIVQGIHAVLENFHGFLSIEVQFDRHIPYITEVRMDWDEILLLNCLSNTQTDWLALWQAVLSGKWEENLIQWKDHDALNILVDVTTSELLEQIQRLPKTWQIGLARSPSRRNIRMAALQIGGDNLSDAYRRFCDGWKQAGLSPDSFLYYKIETFWQQVQTGGSGSTHTSKKPSLPKKYFPKQFGPRKAPFPSAPMPATPPTPKTATQEALKPATPQDAANTGAVQQVTTTTAAPDANAQTSTGTVQLPTAQTQPDANVQTSTPPTSQTEAATVPPQPSSADAPLNNPNASSSDTNSTTPT